MDQNTFNGTFWITISGIISALIIALIAGFNKSKCVSIECCGLKCIRNTDGEIQLEEFKIEHNIPESPVNKV